MDDITAKAKKKYNEIMFYIGREYLTIGTRFSESTEKWNLRDMVSEMQYTLNIYNDPNCVYYEDAHDTYLADHAEIYSDWVKEKARMERFINHWKDEALKMKCTEGHCSRFD